MPRKNLKIKTKIYDGVALVVSVQSGSPNIQPDIKPICQFCVHCEKNGSACSKDFKNVHEEADIICEQVFKRFDNENLIQLKDPSTEEISQAINRVKERMAEHEEG